MTTPGNLTYAQLKGVWLEAAKGTRYASNTWASLMAAIAEAESGGDPLATNPTDNNGTQTSWGLWQISNGTHSEPSPSWSDPATNAKLAIAKLNGQGLSAWGTYNSGAYKAFLSDKTAADLTAAGGPSAVDTAAVAQEAKAGATCLWGFAGANLHNIGLGFIHGPSSVGAFCVVTRSQARGLVGAGLLLGGGLLALAGVQFMVTAAVGGTVLRVIGLRSASPKPTAPKEKAPKEKTAAQIVKEHAPEAGSEEEIYL